MRKKLTYKFVKEQVEKEGYKLLSDLYVNANTKLKVKCPKEHQYKVTYGKFYSGKRCPICYGNKKHSYEYIKEKIEKEGYELLSKEYKNCSNKLKIKCNEEHEFEMNQNNFQQGQRCPICYKNNHSGENHPNWKGGYNSKDIPLYDTYAHQISYAEQVRRCLDDKNVLEVKCVYCGKWYIPTLNEIYHRINSLNGKQYGESNLYCSDECKQQCPVFWKQNYQSNHPYNDNIKRPYQTEWSNMVKENVNFKCEICGKHGNIAHHILPVKTHPHLQADIDNGLCLCEVCHDKYGHKDECSTGQLKKLVC